MEKHFFATLRKQTLLEVLLMGSFSNQFTLPYSEICYVWGLIDSQDVLKSSFLNGFLVVLSSSAAMMSSAQTFQLSLFQPKC